MDEYKISLWEDYSTSCYVQDSTVTSEEVFNKKTYYTKQVDAEGNITYTVATSYAAGTTYYYLKFYFDEREICTLGSNEMETPTRAFEPQLTEDINGTHSFTFRMLYTYVDEFTGEKIKNPLINFLSNERKIKVKWKDEWYDFIIKNCEENSDGKSIIYTCNDLFINELSKNGYSLEFNSELQNNTGTVGELVTKVLDGTDWQYDSTGSSSIIQKNEEPVYEVGNEETSAYKLKSFQATRQDPAKAKAGEEEESETIPDNAVILVFYSQAQNLYDAENTEDIFQATIQFLYAPQYYTEENSMLVTNGNCYSVNLYWKNFSGGYLNAYSDSGATNYVFRINCGNGVSENYRAERLVKTQISEYDELLKRYCYLYNEGSGTNAKKVYGIETTEYSDFLEVTNYLANSSSFNSTNGWIGNVSTWGIYPKFTSSTSVSSYTATSYLLVTSGNTYNTCFTSNSSKFTPTSSEIKSGEVGGFQKGDQFIFRYKAKTNNSSSEPDTYVSSSVIFPFVCKYNSSDYTIPSGATNYLTYSDPTISNNWVEYICTANQAIAANEITQLGFFIQTEGSYWIEDIQFFKYMQGKDNTSGDLKTIYPGDASTLSVATKVYKYFYKNHTKTGSSTEEPVESAKDLVYIYTGEAKSSAYTPVYNNYEKYGSIEEKESNRFNILQSIAETFECWIRFNIQHDSNGKITVVDGVQQKFVTIVEEIGTDNGLSFEYGIDLKSISRTIASDAIATKVIVLQNENDYAINGFCTIARSEQNYSRENFILDLGYYTSQGLINQTTLDKDLYSTQEGCLGYYYYLHNWNSKYDALTEDLTELKTELTKQESELKVITEKLTAASEEIGDTKSDLMRLANVISWSEVDSYVQAHTDNTRVQSLMNTYAQLVADQTSYSTEKANLETTISTLKNNISEDEENQDEFSEATAALHESFNKKYSRFLQEGTWQDESYIDDDLYYLDGLSVAYTSSRPQVSYDINVIRLSSLDEFSSKIFKLGDICYVQDREFFGYGSDGVTPYKEKILVSKIVSNFDSPEKDVVTVQNYKTQFDDLFQRITAATQSLTYAEGQYNKAAGVINPDKTLSFAALQDTFDYNSDLVLNASNQNVVWDSTGITVTDNTDSAKKAKLMAGGLFISNDGGVKWKNAVRGDGISADVLTAGKINTNEIYLYDGNYNTFRWDSQGINAYYFDTTSTSFSKYIRFDRFGLYGYSGNEDFVPELEYSTTSDSVWGNTNVKFGMTWRGFFLRGGGSDASQTSSFKIESYKNENETDTINLILKNWSGTNSLELSSDNDIVLKANNVERINIGRFNNGNSYGLRIVGSEGGNILTVDTTGSSDLLGGWNLNSTSFYHRDSDNNEIGLYSTGKYGTIQGITDYFNINANNKFGVTTDGRVCAASGKIGGWTLGESTLVSSTESGDYSLTLDSGGSISGGNSTTYWSINRNGTATFQNITANGGTIAGWTITSSGLISSTGTITSDSGNWSITGSSINISNGGIGGSTIGNGVISGGKFTNVDVSGTLHAGDLTISNNTISFGGTTLTVNEGYITSSGGFTSTTSIVSRSDVKASGSLSGISLKLGSELDAELTSEKLKKLLVIETALNTSATTGYVLTKGANNSLQWAESTVGENPTFESLTVTGPTNTHGLVISSGGRLVFTDGTATLDGSGLNEIKTTCNNLKDLDVSTLVKQNDTVHFSGITVNSGCSILFSGASAPTLDGTKWATIWNTWGSKTPDDFMPASGSNTAVFG